MFDWIYHLIHRDRKEEIPMHTPDRPIFDDQNMQHEQNWSVLREILHIARENNHELRHIRRMLEPRFTATIIQLQPQGASMSVQQGGTGTFQLQVTASDNSTVTLASVAFTASDSAVTIAPNTADATGASVIVTVPASDTGTSFTLSATAQATSTTVTTPQSVSASTSVTIVPTTVPVTFTASIVQTA